MTDYVTVWHGGIASPDGGFTKGELLPPYLSPVGNGNHAVTEIGTVAEWEALAETDPSLLTIGMFGKRKIKFGTELHGSQRWSRRYQP